MNMGYEGYAKQVDGTIQLYGTQNGKAKTIFPHNGMNT